MPEPRAPEKPPKDLIPHEKMIPVIIDLQILESHYQKQYQRANLYKEALDSAAFFVFDKHNVAKDQFERSYQYYAMDLPVMFMLLEATLDTINLRANQQVEVPVQ